MDLHIHTCLSPCGDSRMTAPEIITRAGKAQLDAIGISDHNTCENVWGIKEAAMARGLPVLGGMEITTSEEVHLLVFFEDQALVSMQEIIYQHLPGENSRDVFGSQYVTDREGYVITENRHLLIGAMTLSLEAIVSRVHNLGGIVIASHIDKMSNSLINQLGFIPDDLELDAIEISPAGAVMAADFTDSGFPLVTFSDAHFPGDIGLASTRFYMEAATIAELKLALSGRAGREVRARQWKN